MDSSAGISWAWVRWPVAEKSQIRRVYEVTLLSSGQHQTLPFLVLCSLSQMSSFAWNLVDQCRRNLQLPACFYLLSYICSVHARSWVCLPRYGGLVHQSQECPVLVAKCSLHSSQHGDAMFHLKGHLQHCLKFRSPKGTCLACPESCPKSVLAFPVSLEVLEKATALQTSFASV